MGRSECPNCSHQLQWYDLAPLISYLYLKGVCRYCKKEITIIYPIVELTVGLAFFSYFWANGFAIDAGHIFYLATIALLLLLIFFDALYLILPDKLIFSIIGLSAVNAIARKLELPNLFLSGFLLGLGFGIIYLVSRGEWMGFGDVKLAFAIGFLLGYPLGLLAIIIAVWTAALWGIVLLLFKKATRKTALPFGSFLSLATIIFIIFKNAIEEKINIFWNFF